jgi:hypothetical protein
MESKNSEPSLLKPSPPPQDQAALEDQRDRVRALLRSPELDLLREVLTDQQVALYRQALQPGLSAEMRTWNAAQQALLGHILGDTLPQQLLAVVGVDKPHLSKSDFDSMENDLGPETY